MEVEAIVERVKVGELGAMLELWEAVRRFVEMKARERAAHPGCRVPLDDLNQAGFLAVVEAAEAYDPEREQRGFLALLSYVLRKRFAEEAGVRSSKRDALYYADSADNVAYRDDPDGPTIAETVPDDRAALAFMGVEYADFVTYCRGTITAALATLKDTQAAVIRLHYLEGRTLEEAAELCGLSSKQAASEAESRAAYRLEHGKYRRELRECLEAFEDFHTYEYAAQSSTAGRYRRTGTSVTEAAGLIRTGGVRK